MTDQNLPELLEQAADRVPVGPAPIAGIVTGATRVRRRRAVLALVGSTALAAIVGGAVVFAVPDGASTPQPLVASPEPDPAPAGMRLVGLEHAAVAVPETWGTNVMRCADAKEDSVLIDIVAVPLCAHPRPEGVESVEVAQGEPRFDFTVDETLRIDDVPAQRQATACTPSEGVRVCAGTIYIPSMRVSFRAESSTSPAEVDRILDRVRIMPERVGVPGHQGRHEEKYLEMLRDTGLVARVRTTTASPFEGGEVVDTTPRPGTMLGAGDVVTVTVAAEPDGRADDV